MKAVKDANARAEQQERYLRAVSRTGTLTAGCKAARVSPNTIYAWREFDVDFALREREARNAFADALEQEAVRRAWHGTKKPVYQGGTLVGYVQEYSDQLLVIMLKALRPEKYRERVEQSVSGTVTVQYTNDWRPAHDDAAVSSAADRT
jgi:hypothetical protein